METCSVNSFEEIYQIVCGIKRKHFKNEEMWFRGQGANTYKLEPGLFRTNRGIERENDIYYKYKQLVSRIKGDCSNEWETLINMQHYGIPTRLLDWTDNLGVALYFAETTSVTNVPMSLFLINPLALNKLSNKNDILLLLPDKPTELSYINNYIEKKPFPARYPIAIKSNWVNDRIWAQSGMFTVHGDEKENDAFIEELANKNAIFQIDISPDAHNSLSEYFQISGINIFKIFPDIQGIGRHLRDLAN